MAYPIDLIASVKERNLDEKKLLPKQTTNTQESSEEIIDPEAKEIITGILKIRNVNLLNSSKRTRSIS